MADQKQSSGSFSVIMWCLGLVFLLGGVWAAIEAFSKANWGELISASISIFIGLFITPSSRKLIMSSISKSSDRQVKPPTDQTSFSLQKNAKLTLCKACRSPVSKTASKCPNCGQGNPGVPTWAYWLTAAILLGLPASCVVSVLNTPPRVIDAHTDLSSAGYQHCKNSVREGLQSPSTALFAGDYSSWKTEGQQIYTIKSEVEAQNALGALLKTGWRCKIQFIGQSEYLPEDWKILEISVDAP